MERKSFEAFHIHERSRLERNYVGENIDVTHNPLEPYQFNQLNERAGRKRDQNDWS